MKKRIPFLVVTLSILLLSGKVNTPIEQFYSGLVIPYLRFFSLPREHVYTHFNKSCYLPGDAIWFKCYVFNPGTKLPSVITSNLIAELYDPDGKLVEQKILYTEEGSTANVFQLDPGSPAGIYTFRAYTSWMRNFTRLSDISTQLKVLGDHEGGMTGDEPEYDIQFLPESGTLLEGMINKVAIKAVGPDGMGVPLTGDILDGQGEVITSFVLNELGMGSILINFIPDIKLHCRISHADGSHAIHPFPEASKKGIIARVDPFRNDKVFITISTNDSSLTGEQMFYLMIHRNGNVLQLASFLMKPDRLGFTLMFDKKDLSNGVNCLTVFNADYEPVAERLFYVLNKDIRGSVSIEGRKSFGVVTLKTGVADPLGVPVSSDLSISVLPAGSISGNFTGSLLAEILLQSDLRGNIENPAYYFESDDKSCQVALDDLLLTQGWRKYDWKEIADTLSKQPDHQFDQGFSIVGEVKGWLTRRRDIRSRISFFALEKGLFDLTETDSLGRFSFTNLYFPEKAHVNLTAVNESGTGWNRELTSRVYPEYKPDSVIEKPASYPTLPQEEGESAPLQLVSDVILLDEVTIVDKRIESPFERTVYRPIMGRTVEITEENVHWYSTVEDLLMKEFNVRTYYDPGSSAWTVDMGRGTVTIMGKNPNPALVMNDIIISDMHWLFALNVMDIEAIAVDKTGLGFGIWGAGGAIIVKTRTTPLYGYRDKINVNTLVVRGYSNPVAYYLPKYEVLPPDPLFTKYAGIFWKPDLVTGDDGEAMIRFEFPFALDSVDVRIEGMTGEGIIFLEEKRVSLEY